MESGSAKETEARPSASVTSDGSNLASASKFDRSVIIGSAERTYQNGQEYYDDDEDAATGQIALGTDDPIVAGKYGWSDMTFKRR
jgi:hypothetical protein